MLRGVRVAPEIGVAVVNVAAAVSEVKLSRRRVARRVVHLRSAVVIHMRCAVVVNVSRRRVA